MTGTKSSADTPGPDTVAGMPRRRGFGVDVGGSGIKGGVVDMDTGLLIGDRIKVLTPQPATPSAVAKAIAEVVNGFGWTGPLGVTYPGVVPHGVVRTAANLDKSWIGTNVRDVISAELNGQDVTILPGVQLKGKTRIGDGAVVGGQLHLLAAADGRVAHHGACADPATHRAVEAVFDERVRVHPVAGRWVALPREGTDR